jgi:hypothetical protein
MLEADGGGGGTDWWSLDMETIHTFSQSPDIDAQYQIVDGWQKSAQLVSDHMSQVQEFHDALATAWPPSKSSAAKTYLDRLTGLIKNLNETYEAALANHDALASATLSLSMAKTQMAQVYSQWDTNNKTLAVFNQQLVQKKQSSSGQPSPSPSGEEPPPVTASQQEALRQQAITLMSGVSTDLAQAQLKVVRPTPYTPEFTFDKTTNSPATSATNVPVLPPIVPTSHSTSIGSASSGGSYSPSRGSTTLPNASGSNPATGNSSFPGSTTGNPGLVLGGANPPSALPPTSTGLNQITNLPSNGSITNPGVLPPSTGSFFPGGPPPSSTGNLPNEGSSYKPIGGLPEGGLKAMPPGGIIGRTPVGGLGEPGAARFGTQRVNPVGGVIGEQGYGVGGRGVGGFDSEGMVGGGRGAALGARAGSIGQAGRAGIQRTTSEQPYGQVGGRRSGRRDQSDDMHWDPNNPWATEEGVDPVVLPPLEQRINPGPAIGLS